MSVDRTWVHLLGLTRFTYHRLIRRAGGRPVRVDYSKFNGNRAEVGPILDGSDGLLLAGGGDVDPALYGVKGPARHVNPKRDRFELALLEMAYQRRMPILGICRGTQLMNVSRGGTLRSLRDDEPMLRRHGRMRTHPVILTRDGLMRQAIAEEQLPVIRSLHSQAIDRVGRDLVVAARSSDGVVEAIESAGAADSVGWIAGVQWHPELMLFDQPDRRLIRAFVHAARRRSNQAAIPSTAC